MSTWADMRAGCRCETCCARRDRINAQRAAQRRSASTALHCPTCDGPKPPGAKRCQLCLERKRERRRRYYQHARARLARERELTGYIFDLSKEQRQDVLAQAARALPDDRYAQAWEAAQRRRTR